MRVVFLFSGYPEDGPVIDVPRDWPFAETYSAQKMLRSQAAGRHRHGTGRLTHPLGISRLSGR